MAHKFTEKELYEYLPEIKDFTREGICSCCGECCSDILEVTLLEVEKIRKYITEHNIALIDKGQELQCPFYAPKLKKCLIYNVRPKVCKDFLCCKTKKELVHDIFLRSQNSEIITVSFHVTFLNSRLISDLIKDMNKLFNSGITIL